MTRVIAVGVSEITAQNSDSSLAPWLSLQVVTGSAAAPEVIWRRQTDRTTWLLEALEAYPSVRWVHTDTAGIERLPLQLFADRGIMLSNARGVHTSAVSEWALGAMLLAAKGLDTIVRNSDRRDWVAFPPTFQLNGLTVLILGMGSIGNALAKTCSSLGMHVLGVARTRQPRESDAYLDRLFTAEDPWAAELKRVTFLVVCLPLTESTKGLVDDGILRALRPEAWVINVGRGGVMNEYDLALCVTENRIGGAILDTFAQEPLEPTSPLWGHPNIIISPHTSSFTTRTSARTQDLFIAEAERYRLGLLPKNLIALKRGY